MVNAGRMARSTPHPDPYSSPVHPRDGRQWDREAELEAIRATYDRYDARGRTRLWDTRVPGYRRMAAELQTSLIRALEASVPDPDAVIVDLGCGDGSLAADTRRSRDARRWIGIDLRPEAVAVAQARFPDLTFLAGSADAVPLETGSVDAVVARLLFSSLSTRLEEAVAVEISRLLKPGGWLVWLELRYDNPANPNVHGLSAARIGQLFPGWPRELRSLGLLPPLARRLGPATPIAYPALAAIPPLRSHLVGRLQKPQGGT